MDLFPLDLGDIKLTMMKLGYIPIYTVLSERLEVLSTLKVQVTLYAGDKNKYVMSY